MAPALTSASEVGAVAELLNAQSALFHRRSEEIASSAIPR